MAEGAVWTPWSCCHVAVSVRLWYIKTDGGFDYAGGRPLVVADPLCDTSQAFMDLGAAVVREIAKLKMVEKNAVRCENLVA